MTVLLLSGCAGEQPAPWHQENGYRWREVHYDRGHAGFTSVGGRSGVQFQNDVSDSVLLGNRMLAQGAGIALGDVDGDGRVDVFLARTQGSSALYRNLGGWRFEDITERARVGAADRHSSGATFADVDGDGDLDLLLLATTGPNAIFVNDGTGVFSERRDLGLDTTGRGGTTPAFADVDGDGDLDLYVANYKPYSPVDTLPPQLRNMAQMVRQVRPNEYAVIPERARDFKVVNRPDMGGLNVSMIGEPDEFYINEGGRFRRELLTAGRFRDTTGKPIANDFESFTLDARFVDLNGDGAPDLYVANDFEDTDQLWINDGRGGFRQAPWTAQRQTSNSSMGVDAGDVNGDGLPDLFVSDMLSNDTRRLKTQMPTHTALPKKPGDITAQLQQQRNTLFLNRGDGTFAEVSAYAGVQASGWSWSTLLTDVDLDGWQDILIAAGHLWDLMDADVQERLQNRLTDVEWQRQRWQFPRLALKNVAMRNRGDLTYEDVSARWKFGTEAAVSHALAAADLDDDGDLDVVVGRLRAPTLLLRNDANAPRVAVRLVGTAPNTAGIGARMRLSAPGMPIQAREVASGGLYLSHSDHQASFAMGSADSATLTIEWRSGRRTSLTVHPNRAYEINESTASGLQLAARDAAASRQPRAASLFEDVSAQLGGHLHTDPPFDDWERQFLLPNSLGQLGPGVTWFDFDRDGDEDLVIGAGRGGRLGVFRNDRGRLTPMRGGPEAAQDFTTILGLPGGRGSSSSLLVGVSEWETSPRTNEPVPAPVMRIAAGAAGSGAATTAASPFGSAAGPMALGDYDNDGDLDLFVGGRAIRAQYPREASSVLLRNDGDAFAADGAAASLFKDIGLVSAAMFADADGDGDADLLLAREWGSIVLFLNNRGAFTRAPDSWGLERWSSRWNGLAAGDLNGDGKLDLVATSWGRNTMMPADTSDPLVLVHGPIGSGGEEEPLMARRDPRLRGGGLATYNSYPRTRVAIPDLVKRLGTFASFADATVDSVLGPMKSRARQKQAVTLDHMAFINRGDRFEPTPLPRDAQLAPAFHASVADFDGDGNEDVFISQNFYPTAVGVPRYDAGRALLMRGDGTGALQPMTGAESGLLVYGDQRGAAHADFDADGRLDLVISQNASTTRLLHNTGAKPGLRVRLRGAAGNADAIGAQIRILYGETPGPAREVQAGSGYWSQNGAVQVFGLRATPTAVWVRWPGGNETRTPVPAGAREVVIAAP